MECLDRDAFAGIAVAQLEQELKHGAIRLEALDEAGIEKARRARDKRETPARLRKTVARHTKSIEKREAALAALLEERAEAKRRLDAGDLRPIENRTLVKGTVVRIEPKELVRLSDRA